MKKLLRILFVAVFLNALAWIIIIPVWQYPDEQAHFAQVQDIAEIGKVPPSNNTSLEINRAEQVLDTERDGGGNNKFTYHPEFKNTFSSTTFGPSEKEIRDLPIYARKQMVKTEATQNPPLYYFLASIAYKLAYGGSLFERVYVVRFFSAILFLLNVFIAYKIAKLVFEKNQTLQIALPLAIGFTPMLVFASTGILPDPLTNLLFSVIILFCLDLIKRGPSFKNLVAVAAAIYLGFQTRQQLLIAIPLVAFALLIYFIKARAYKKLAMLTVTVLAIPLFFKLFPSFYNLPEIGIPSPLLLFTSDFLISFRWTLQNSYAQTLPWYWGVYKWLSLTLPHPAYQIINRLLVLSLFGLLIHFFRVIRNKKFKNIDVYLLYLVSASLVYFLFFAVGDFFFQHQSRYTFGIQGRYFFPLVVAHMAIILAGFWGLAEIFPKKIKRFFLPIMVLLFFALNDFSLYFVASSYYDTSSIGTFITQASQYKPLIFKGNIIIVVIALSIISQLFFLFNYGRDIIKENESS